MKIVLGTAKTILSCRKLRDELIKHGHDCVALNPFKKEVPPSDVYLGIGCSKTVRAPLVLNKRQAVLNCVSKSSTFSILNHHKLPCPEWCWGRENIPDNWEQIVARKDDRGFGAKDLEFYYEKEEIPEEYVFFSKAHFWKHEYRVMVVLGKPLVYYKDSKKVEGSWCFIPKDHKEYPEIVKACKKASEALGTDYVGFDVLAHNKSKFVILEANSGAIIPDEAIAIFVKYFNKLKG